MKSKLIKTKVEEKAAEPSSLSVKKLTVFIYALLDPDTLEVRYIGKSINPEKRFTVHICRSSAPDSYRKRWLKKLLTAGKRPVLRIIEEVPIESWVERERFWIADYRSRGARLVNSTSGGEGFADIPPEVEAARRIKISASRMGMKFTEEHKANLKASRKCLFSNPGQRARVCREQAVLTDVQVLEVWNLAASRSVSQRGIAQRYKIPQSTVSQILTSKRYVHVPRPRQIEVCQYQRTAF